MIKQVILFRKDLNMRKGKIAAQVAHASMKVFFDRRLLGENQVRSEKNIPVYDPLVVPLTADMREWVFGVFTKIVLSVESEADLLLALDLAEQAGLPCAIIQDMGATEFHGVPTYTTVAIGPARSELIDLITGKGGFVATALA